MERNSRILVVDDEAIVCESCTRILSREGFGVETNTNPREGLKLAESNDYDAILLDMKMNEMDGIEFLEALRRKNIQSPVIVITGYPSIEHAASLLRLGAADYILKPFNPTEITRSVKRIVEVEREPAKTTDKGDIAEARKPDAIALDTSPACPFEPAAEDTRFFGQSWFKLGLDGTAHVGAILPVLDEKAMRNFRLPELGQTVHQGLPLASVSVDGKIYTVPTAISGQVLEVNRHLQKNPGGLWKKPNESWIARIKPTSLEVDRAQCEVKTVTVVAATSGNDSYIGSLTEFGCKPVPRTSIQAAMEDLKHSKSALVFIDEKALGSSGPTQIETLLKVNPAAKIVLLAQSGSQLEQAYRASKIFYYAVQPVDERELLDILFSAFQRKTALVARRTESSLLPKWINRIRITNKSSKSVSLLAFGDALVNTDGVGQRLIQKLLTSNFPIEITHGLNSATPETPSGRARIVKEAAISDTVIVFQAKNLNQIPGSLIKEEHPLLESGRPDSRLVNITIQPANNADASAFEGDVADALALRIWSEMAS